MLAQSRKLWKNRISSGRGSIKKHSDINPVLFYEQEHQFKGPVLSQISRASKQRAPRPTVD